MCEKEGLLVHIPDLDYEALSKGQDALPFFELHADINRTLTEYKDRIDHVSGWDQVKKYSNDFEFIFTSLGKMPCVASIHPPSRSYFKLWEMLKLFEGVFKDTTSGTGPVSIACIAEGPGGFIECLADWLHKEQRLGDTQIHGITLIAKEKMIPQWRLSKRTLNTGRVTLHAGKDGTGDIYSLDNIHHFVDAVGRHSCAWVTADGGFDIHGRFNQQEHVLQHLILCEMYTAFHVQKVGGGFILKMFDMYSTTSLQLLYILKIFYRDIFFIKPVSSRPANAEKYVVCTGFKGLDGQAPIVRAMEQIIDSLSICDDSTPFYEFIPCQVPAAFLQVVTTFNMQYAFRQMYHIAKTLTYIDIMHSCKYKTFQKEVIWKQYLACREWCEYHGIPFTIITQRDLDAAQAQEGKRKLT